MLAIQINDQEIRRKKKYQIIIVCIVYIQGAIGMIEVSYHVIIGLQPCLEWLHGEWRVK